MGQTDRTDKTRMAEAWVDEHADALFAYALSRVRDRSTAEDLIQETFLAGIRAQDTFRGESSPRTWLIGILRHKLLDHLRKRSRQRPVEDIEDVDSAVDGQFDTKGRWSTPPADWAVDPTALIQRQEFWAVFQQCLEALPERLREAFSLRTVDERQSVEVCNLLGISATNLWVMLHRARARLRACLETHWFASDSQE